MAIPQPQRQSSALVVDDHAAARWVFAQALSALGYTNVLAASSRLTALSHCEAQPFDVVLVDLSLGGEDGLELIDELRLSVGVGRIIALSADAHRLQAAASRADALLAKPLDPIAFVRVVGRPRPSS